MLRLAKEGEPGSSTELDTAAARWRPAGGSRARGTGRRAPARGEVGLGGREGAAWGGGRSKRWPAASAAAGGAELCRRG